MADPRKVRWSQLKVGVVGLAAFLILAVLIFLLTSSKGFFQKTATLRTFMDDASGLAEGTPVRLNGFTIGSLDQIRLIAGSEPIPPPAVFSRTHFGAILTAIPFTSPA